MKIIELRAENVKRLQAVQVKPDGSLVVIGGKNGAGKSSLLDSIVYALNGAGSLPGKPIRTGQEKAEIEITLDSNPKLVIRRRIREGGKTDLEIKQVSSDGLESKVTSPQKMLESLCGTIAFDPLAFTRLRPQDQCDMLRKLVGVDLSDLDAEAKQVFDDRTAVNRDLKAFESQVAAAPKFDDAPAAEVSAADLLDAIEKVRQYNSEVEAAAQSARSAVSEAERKANDYARQMQVIDRLKDDLKAAEALLESLGRDSRAAHDDAMAARSKSETMVRQDDSGFRAKLSAAEETNRKVRANAARQSLVEKLNAAREQSEGQTRLLEELRQKRVARMADATWPVDGLGFSDSGITFNALPFEQCSSAEQLRISTAIGLAQHPKLRVLLIRDGSLLDEDGLAAIAELAAEHDAQVWCERVGKGQECSLIIEDGSVAVKPELDAAVA